MLHLLFFSFSKGEEYNLKKYIYISLDIVGNNIYIYIYDSWHKCLTSMISNKMKTLYGLREYAMKV